MCKEGLIFFIIVVAFSVTTGQYLGLGGTPGNRTPRTGSSWPPYPGAGGGYWANRAGVYNGRQPTHKIRRGRTKGHRLYAGFGGVVGNLTPRASGGGHRNRGSRNRHGCQMAIARFLNRMCLALRA